MTHQSLPLVQRCLGCRRTETVYRGRCASCGGHRTVIEACASIGKVTALTVLHRSAAFDAQPGTRVIALIEVDGGAVFMGNLHTTAAVGERIDMHDVGFPTAGRIVTLSPDRTIAVAPAPVARRPSQKS